MHANCLLRSASRSSTLTRTTPPRHVAKVFNCFQSQRSGALRPRQSARHCWESRSCARRKQYNSIVCTATQEAKETEEGVFACKRIVTVKVPAEECKKSFNNVVNELQRQTGAVPGFRKQKLPLNVLIQQNGGQKRFKEAVLELVLTNSIDKAMASQLAHIPESVRVASDIQQLVESFDPTKPLEYEVEFEVVPPVTWRSSYHDIQVSYDDNGSLQTDIAATEDLIRRYRKDNGGFTRVVQGRGLEKGDVAVIDLKMHEKGHAANIVPGLTKVKFSFDTDEDPLGLTSHLTGLKPGDSVTFDLLLPDDYNLVDWRGKTVTVTVNMYDLLSWNLPEFNDEWVKTHYPAFDSAEDMHKTLVATTTMERLKALEQTYEDALYSALASIATVPALPESLVKSYGMRNFQSYLLELVQKGQLSQEQLAEQATESFADQYTLDNWAVLEEQVRVNLGLDDIFKREGLQIEPDVLEAEVASRKQEHKDQDMEYDEAVLRDEMTDVLTNMTAMAWLKQKVKPTIRPFQSA